MSRGRDNQRQRVYDSELVLSRRRTSTAAKRFLKDTEESQLNGRKIVHPSVKDTIRYIEAVQDAAWFTRRFGYRRFFFKEQRSGWVSRAGFGNITLQPYHRKCEETILHEMAHNLTGPNDAWHGPEFAGVLLTLVRYQMGKEAADELRASYKAKRVRYNMKRVPSPSKSRMEAAKGRKVKK